MEEKIQLSHCMKMQAVEYSRLSFSLFFSLNRLWETKFILRIFFNFKGKALRMRFVGSLGKTVLVVMCKMKKIEHLSTFIFKILFLLSEAGGEFIKKFLPYSSRRLYHTHHESARLFSYSE